MTPTNKSDTISFFFIPPPINQQPEIVSHFKRKKRKANIKEESQVIFHLLLCVWADAGGRSNLIDGWMWWWVGGYFSIRY